MDLSGILTFMKSGGDDTNSPAETIPSDLIDPSDGSTSFILTFEVRGLNSLESLDPSWQFTTKGSLELSSFSISSTNPRQFDLEVTVSSNHCLMTQLLVMSIYELIIFLLTNLKLLLDHSI